jgi:hypothetical protein
MSCINIHTRCVCIDIAYSDFLQVSRRDFFFGPDQTTLRWCHLFGYRETRSEATCSVVLPLEREKL